MAGYEVLRGAMRMWYDYHFAQSGDVPKPRDTPSVVSMDPSANRMLLVGNGPCHGWGVTTHQLAITGHLSRALHRMTGVPTAVDYVGDERMNVRAARSWIGDRDLGGYHVVVIVMGINDSVRLTPVNQWIAELKALIDYVVEATDPSTRVVVTAVQTPRMVSVYSGSLGRVAELHARRLNDATQALLDGRQRVQFSNLSAQSAGAERKFGSPELYKVWGAELADLVMAPLRLTRSERDETPVPASASWQWPVTKHVVELAKTGGSEELQRLATEAQEAFGVEFAVVTLLDGDRLWYGMNTHILPQSLPRELAYCNTTVQEDKMLVVPDARKDRRFAGGALVEMIGLPFYAGLPLRSAAGDTIGTFCILGATPRDPAKLPLGLLHDFAAQAEAELWRLDGEAAVHPGEAVTTFVTQ